MKYLQINNGNAFFMKGSINQNIYNNVGKISEIWKIPIEPQSATQ